MWCIAHVVTNSVVSEHGGLSHVAFWCCVTRKGPCGAFVTTDFFFGEGLMLPVCCAYTVTQASHGVAPRTIFSWIPRRVRNGAADGMWRHRRLSGASRSALCSLCSPIQRLGSGSDFYGELQNPCHEQKKAWSQNADVGQRSQCSAGDFGGGHDTQTYVSSG